MTPGSSIVAATRNNLNAGINVEDVQHLVDKNHESKEGMAVITSSIPCKLKVTRRKCKKNIHTNQEALSLQEAVQSAFNRSSGISGEVSGAEILHFCALLPKNPLGSTTWGAGCFQSQKAAKSNELPCFGQFLREEHSHFAQT